MAACEELSVFGFFSLAWRGKWGELAAHWVAFVACELGKRQKGD